ncbi:unnamed protein product, partial [Phaeothamnion confervicola]
AADTGAAAAAEAATPPPPAAAAAAAGGDQTAFDFEVPFNGKQYPMSKFLGKATLIVNCKIDDPISLEQVPPILQLANKYRTSGLHVILVPTDQGYFEADEDRVVKIKLYQFYGFGQFPTSVVLDKVDIVGNTAHPLFKFLCRRLKNPNGIGRFTLDYEKFLLDAQGVPVRRYPRKLGALAFEADVQAVLEGKGLPPETREYTAAWYRANAEAERSEYAFKLGLNYYNNS